MPKVKIHFAQVFYWKLNTASATILYAGLSYIWANAVYHATYSSLIRKRGMIKPVADGDKTRRNRRLCRVTLTASVRTVDLPCLCSELLQVISAN